MFELSVAAKYLIPRARQLSVSIISVISVVVIAVVVWLILVFFSVTDGLENMWVQRMVALTAPLRVTPTQAYYDSYYFRVDSISAASGYSSKSVGEKAEASVTDPYDATVDEEVPEDWPSVDRREDGSVKDLVKELYEAIGSITHPRDLRACDYEMTAANVRLQLIRPGDADQRHASLSQATYLLSFDSENLSLKPALQPLTMADVENVRSLNPFSTAATPPTQTPSTEYSMPPSPSPLWIYSLTSSGKTRLVLPKSSEAGEGILVAKNFRDSGVLVGDRGYIAYYAPTTTSVQEQRLPIYIAGFFDPGIIPIGGRFAIIQREAISTIREAQHTREYPFDNGLHLRFSSYDKARDIQRVLMAELQRRGIDRYWKVETFHDYEFTKDLMQQLRSEKNLFSLISLIIVIVACSNIISMLIILVNDKKKEIGILRSMGATSWSMGLIFGLCGMVMGLVGSLLGTGAALFTLSHLDALLALISKLQGFEVFNAAFYGPTIPRELSGEALAFVFMATLLISLLAGVVPAIKASRLNPSAALRAE